MLRVLDLSWLDLPFAFFFVAAIRQSDKLPMSQTLSSQKTILLVAIEV